MKIGHKKYNTFSDKIYYDWESTGGYVYAPSDVQEWYLFDDPSRLRSMDVHLGYCIECANLKVHFDFPPSSDYFVNDLV